MTKPLGYYLNDITHEGASEIEKLLNDLSQDDKLGLIEWLTYAIRDDLTELRNIVQVETE